MNQIQSATPFLRRPQLWLGLIAATIILRFIAMALVPLEAHEAYYWMYAQHLNLSYFDHPPMVAWVIRAGTAIFGDTEFGVRIIGCLLMCAAAALLYLHARIWYSRTAALIGAAGILILPVYFGNAFMATMDAPLVFFWALGMLGVSLAISRAQPRWWYLAGLGMGAAMLTKYTGIFLGLGGLLTVLGHPDRRRHLLSIHPFLACLLALAIFSPVLIWNYQHDWASFRFQFLNRFGSRGLTFKTPLSFLGLQIAVATPILLIGTFRLTYRLARRPLRLTIQTHWWIAFCFSAPLIAIMAYKSLKYPIHINWTLPAYLSLMPAIAHLALALGRTRATLISWPHALRWTGIVGLAGNFAIASFMIFAKPGNGVIPAFGRWKELAAIVQEYELRFEADTGREPFVIAQGSYRLAALMAYYRAPFEDPGETAKFTTSQWLINGEGVGFEYWSKPHDWLGMPCIIVEPESDPIDLRGCFESITIVDDPRLKRIGYRLALCTDYRGPRHLVRAD